jgi:uncharacterized protein (DUF924 family)/RimJ/RimL family protein N-acetyltransferase
MDGPEDVLRFWFPALPPDDPAAMPRQLEWWFRGGADADIGRRFRPLFESATSGMLDGWADKPRSRLALIIVLDQFSRMIHRGDARAYACDAKARSLTRSGIDAGHYSALDSPWEKTFFFLPLGHSEDLRDLERAVQLAEELARQAAPDQRRMLEHSASQARGHRDVVARFGRQPHRNAVLGRISTPEELAYLASSVPVHQRPIPPQSSPVRRFRTARLVLRRPDLPDAPAIFERYASDAEVTRFLSWPRHSSLDATRAFIEFSDERWARWPAGPYLIETPEGTLLGGTGLAFETPERASTGYVLARDAWGQGYATEALGGMVGIARMLGIVRLEATCHAEHRPSAHVLEKNGFVCQGRLPRHTVFPNLDPRQPCDVLAYALALS